MSENLSQELSGPEFQKIVQRRIPIKLLQFARLLSELMLSEIDPVRIKAMESQIRKTRETCDEYGIESTAHLLAHIQSQLHLDSETLASQKPLVMRFVQRLESHAERLKLGQVNSGAYIAVKQAQQNLQHEQVASANESATPSQNDSTHPVEAPESSDDLAEASLDISRVDPEETLEVSAIPEEIERDPAPIAAEPLESDAEVSEETAINNSADSDETWDTEISEQSAVKLESAPQTPSGLYEFQHTVVSSNPTQPVDLLEKASEQIIYWAIENEHSHARIRHLLSNFGYEVIAQSFTEALALAAGNSQKMVIAKLEELAGAGYAANQTSQLIVFSDHDTLENRLQGVRLGSTLFLASPIDSAKLFQFIDNLEEQGASTPFRIAVMEDSKAQAKFNDKVLTGAGFETCIITEPMSLLNALSNFDPEVIFMDMQMPDCNGVELTRVLRQLERFQTVPIVFLSAEENPEKQQEAMTSGGTAFIPKPVKKEQMLFMAELYARRNRHLQPHLARDFQTGLSSSALLKEQLIIEAERAMRQNSNMFLAFIEINQLAELNDRHGYAFGERVLQQLSRLLRQRLRKTDCIGFFDLQKIGVILSNCNDAEAEAVMSYLTQTFSDTPILFEQESVAVSLSVGLSKLGSDYDIQRVVKRSLAALEQAHATIETHLVWAHEAR